MRAPRAPGLLERRSAASGCNLKRVMHQTLPPIKMYPGKNRRHKNSTVANFSSCLISPDGIKPSNIRVKQCPTMNRRRGVSPPFQFPAQHHGETALTTLPVQAFFTTFCLSKILRRLISPTLSDTSSMWIPMVKQKGDAQGMPEGTKQ